MSRILIVTNVFPPLIGGPATFADGLAHVLAARGHKVTVVCSSDEKRDAADSRRPFSVRRVVTANRYLYEVKVRARLAVEFMRHRRILVIGLETYVRDVVRLVARRYVLRVPGDTAWEAARYYGVTTLPFEEFQSAPKPPLIEAMARKRRAYLACASTVITPSRHLAGLVRRWLPEVPDLRTIENGVRLEDYPAREARPRGARPLKALYVGRLNNWKGIETILLAARGLAHVEIDIIGDGHEQSMLVGLHGQLGAPSNIVFHGRLGADRVREAMLAADVFLLASEYEGMSNALLEASAAGLVPVISDIAPNREVVADGENGLLVPYGNPAALRAALERLADDDALRLRLAVEARVNATRFSFDRAVDQYVRLIEEAR